MSDTPTREQLEHLAAKWGISDVESWSSEALTEYLVSKGVL